jgi:hypothetical protein
MPNKETETQKLIRMLIENKKEQVKILQEERQKNVELAKDLSKEIKTEKQRMERAREAADAFVEKCNREFVEIYKAKFGD